LWVASLEEVVEAGAHKGRLGLMRDGGRVGIEAKIFERSDIAGVVCVFVFAQGRLVGEDGAQFFIHA
jgi:hypothetical protein